MDDGDRGVFAPLGFRQAVLYSNVRHAVGRFRSKTSSASNSESLDFLHPHWLQRSALFQLGLQLVLGQQIGHPNCNVLANRAGNKRFHIFFELDGRFDISGQLSTRSNAI